MSITEARMLLLTMKAETKPAAAARDEMVKIVEAWKRGRLLPKSEAPMLHKLYGTFDPPLLHIV